jgi:uncharacterized protein
MTSPDYEEAKRYALGRLKQELSPLLYYHSLRHTQDDVLPAIDRLALMEGIAGEPLMLLRTAGAYHDIGFIERYTENEEIAVRIARETLPDFAFSSEQIDVICGIIMATKLPQSPRTRLEQIIADADLDVLGRADYFVWNRALRDELAVYGSVVPDVDWYPQQLQFIQAHRYFTASAHQLRDPQKQRNLEILIELVNNGALPKSL